MVRVRWAPGRQAQPLKSASRWVSHGQGISRSGPGLRQALRVGGECSAVRGSGGVQPGGGVVCLPEPERRQIVAAVGRGASSCPVVTARADAQSRPDAGMQWTLLLVAHRLRGREFWGGWRAAVGQGGAGALVAGHPALGDGGPRERRQQRRAGGAPLRPAATTAAASLGVRRRGTKWALAPGAGKCAVASPRGAATSIRSSTTDPQECTICVSPGSRWRPGRHSSQVNAAREQDTARQIPRRGSESVATPSRS